MGRLVAAYRQSRPTITSEQNGTSTTHPGSTTGNWTVYHYQQGDRGLLDQVSYVLGAPSSDPLSGDPYVVGFGYEAGIPENGAVPWRLHELAYPSQGGQFTVRYDYDAGSGVMTGVRDKAHPSASIWKLTEASQGIQPKVEEFGNGLLTKRQYYSLADATDPSCANGATCVPGTLHTIATQAQAPLSIAPVQALSYQYDSMGNVGSIVDGVDPTQSRVYQYDGLDRLSKEFAGDGTTLLSQTTYDLGGNIRSRFTAQDGNSTYVYQTAGKPYQLDAVTTQSTNGSWVFGYSTTGNGNIASRLGPNVPGFAQQFEYDALNMPARVVSGTSSRWATELEYDGNGSRIIKRRRFSDADNAPVQQLTIDIAELYEQVTDYQQSSTTPVKRVHRYRVNAGGREVAQIERIDGEQQSTQYIHDDRLGSSAASTDGQGNAQVRQYGTFGNPQDTATFASSGVVSGYTGHQHDLELGLVNMRGRIMDPYVGRFITPDPFVFHPFDAAGLNRYSYALNNPPNLTDPSGFDVNPENTRGGAGCGADVMCLPEGLPEDVVNAKPPGPSGNPPGPSGNPPGPSGNPPVGGPPPPGPGTSFTQTDPSFSIASNAVGNANVNYTAGGAGTTSVNSAAQPHSWRPGEIGPPPPPRSWDDPPVPHQGMMPPVGNRVLNDPSFKIEDTSETWKTAMEIVMAVNPLGPEEAAASLIAKVGAGLKAARGLTAAEKATAALAGKLQFTGTTAKHMAEAGRYVPRHTLAEAIQSGTRMADPQGAQGAIKIVQEIAVNGKPKTLEIIFREADNTILHFLYK